MKPEDQLTVSVADYLRLQHPDVLFTHIANERQTSPMRGAKFKRMGVRAGMPDIMVFHPRKVLRGSKSYQQAGLAIELKVGIRKPTDAQVDCLTSLGLSNWDVHVCRSLDDAIKCIDNYFQ